jgi:hypothetical protein
MLNLKCQETGLFPLMLHIKNTEDRRGQFEGGTYLHSIESVQQTKKETQLFPRNLTYTHPSIYEPNSFDGNCS